MTLFIETSRGIFAEESKLLTFQYKIFQWKLYYATLAVPFSHEALTLCSFLQIIPKMLLAESIGALDCFKRKGFYRIFCWRLTEPDFGTCL